MTKNGQLEYVREQLKMERETLWEAREAGNDPVVIAQLEASYRGLVAQYAKLVTER